MKKNFNMFMQKNLSLGLGVVLTLSSSVSTYASVPDDYVPPTTTTTKTTSSSTGKSAVPNQTNISINKTVNTYFVNVRSGMSGTSSVLGVLKKGDVVTVTEVKNGWNKITYNGKTGYIDYRYLTTGGSTSTSTSTSTTTSTTATYATVNTALNLRSSASNSASIIGYLKQGEQITILEQNSNGWYKVLVGGKTVGYVYGKYVTTIGSANSSAGTTTGTTTGTTASTTTGTTTGTTANNSTDGLDVYRLADLKVGDEFNGLRVTSIKEPTGLTLLSSPYGDSDVDIFLPAGGGIEFEFIDEVILEIVPAFTQNIKGDYDYGDISIARFTHYNDYNQTKHLHGYNYESFELDLYSGDWGIDYEECMKSEIYADAYKKGIELGVLGLGEDGQIISYNIPSIFNASDIGYSMSHESAREILESFYGAEVAYNFDLEYPPSSYVEYNLSEPTEPINIKINSFNVIVNGHGGFYGIIMNDIEIID